MEEEEKSYANERFMLMGDIDTIRQTMIFIYRYQKYSGTGRLI